MTTVATLSRELRTIRTSFRELSASFSRIAPALVKQTTAPSHSENGTGRRKPPLSATPARRPQAPGPLHGHTMRGLKPRQRAKVKRVRAAKGIRAAIAEARRMAE